MNFVKDQAVLVKAIIRLAEPDPEAEVYVVVQRGIGGTSGTYVLANTVMPAPPPGSPTYEELADACAGYAEWWGCAGITSWTPPPVKTVQNLGQRIIELRKPVDPGIEALAERLALQDSHNTTDCYRDIARDFLAAVDAARESRD